MALTLHLAPTLYPFLEELPEGTRISLLAHLQRIAELAEYLPPGDARWEGMAQPDADGLRVYVAGCCIRLHVLPGQRMLAVEQIGRVRVFLPEPSPLSA